MIAYLVLERDFFYDGDFYQPVGEIMRRIFTEEASAIQYSRSETHRQLRGSLLWEFLNEPDPTDIPESTAREMMDMIASNRHRKYAFEAVHGMLRIPEDLSDQHADRLIELLHLRLHRVQIVTAEDALTLRDAVDFLEHNEIPQSEAVTEENEKTWEQGERVKEFLGLQYDYRNWL